MRRTLVGASESGAVDRSSRSRGRMSASLDLDDRFGAIPKSALVQEASFDLERGANVSVRRPVPVCRARGAAASRCGLPHGINRDRRRM
jgi:hypothetical protein